MTRKREPARAPFVMFTPVSRDYSMIDATTPAPTVRPPSRMAKRSFSSIAIGTISATVHGDIVARHHHFRALGQGHDAGHVRGAEVELRTIVGEERGVAAALFLGQNIGLGLELGVGLHRAGLAQNLAALHVLALGAAQQAADIVARLALVKQFSEHFNAGHRGLDRRAQAHDLDFLADLDDPALDAPRHHRAAARNREHVLDRHQERLIDRTLRLRNIVVNRLHQLHDGVAAQLRIAIVQRNLRRTLGDRNVVAGEFIFRQQLADFQLDQLQQLRIVDQIDLVQEHHQRRNADLTGEKNVLAGLRHRAVGRRHHQDRAVHLRRAGDHVLHIVGVPGAVDMGVMALRRLIFDMRRRNRDAARLLFRRLVDLVVSGERRPARLRQNLGDRRRQRRLAMVDVTNRSDVAVRLRARKFFLGHGPRSECQASRIQRPRSIEGFAGNFKSQIAGIWRARGRAGRAPRFFGLFAATRSSLPCFCARRPATRLDWRPDPREASLMRQAGIG